MRGFSLTGEILIFKNEYGYSTTINNKDINGNWDRMYISVQLPKGQELNNKTVVMVNKGFLSFYKDKTGLAKPKAVLQQYDIVGEEGTDTIPDVEIFPNNNDDDLPF